MSVHSQAHSQVDITQLQQVCAHRLMSLQTATVELIRRPTTDYFVHAILHSEHARNVFAIHVIQSIKECVVEALRLCVG